MMDDACHPAAESLLRSLEGKCPPEVADRIARGVRLTPDATDAEKAAWVAHTTRELERRLNQDTIREIRKRCHCREEGRLDEMKTWLGGLYRESSSMEEFVDKVNAHGAGWYLRDGEIHTKFLNCECHMLRDVSALDSMTWCLCAEGYTEELFGHVFGREVKSELVQTIRTGHEFCLVKIRLA